MRRLLLICFAATLASAVQAAEVVGYGDVDGQSVELLSDGTWREVNADETGSNTCPKGVLAESAVLPVTLCFDQAVWKETSTAASFEKRYVAQSGRLWAGLITERVPVGRALMRDAILANVEEAGQEARDIKDLDPVVLAPDLRLDAISYVADFKDTEFSVTVYYGTIQGEGALQIMFWTVSSLAEETRTHISKLVRSLRLMR